MWHSVQSDSTGSDGSVGIKGLVLVVHLAISLLLSRQ